MLGLQDQGKGVNIMPGYKQGATRLKEHASAKYVVTMLACMLEFSL
jgi:hypothetical protein